MIIRESKFLFGALSFIFFVACSERPNQEQIVKKIQQKEPLTKNEKCIVDIAISNAIDPKNILVYAASVDVMFRLKVAGIAQKINYCRPMIEGSDASPLLNELAKSCPRRLRELNSKDLDKLNEQAIRLLEKSANFNGSVFEFAFSNCI